MQTAYIKTPLGIGEISGDVNGISAISILDVETEISNEIPDFLVLPVKELNEYFYFKRTAFTFKIQPQGTAFQQKVWQ